jgi:hypothetical protein
MSFVVPPTFLFRYSFAARHVAAVPRRGRKLLDLPTDCAVPNLDPENDASSFGVVSLAWNEGGLGVAVTVRGKQAPTVSVPDQPTESDGLQVWIDTRDTQTIHRASRFCHHFCLLPPAKKSSKPTVEQLPIARSRDEAPATDVEQIRLACQTRKDGYTLEAWFPAESLHGFNVEASPRLGFTYALRDSELGEQFLTVGREFPFAHDPSLWSTVELTR